MTVIASHDDSICYNMNGEAICIYCLNDVDKDYRPDDEENDF